MFGHEFDKKKYAYTQTPADTWMGISLYKRSGLCLLSFSITAKLSGFRMQRIYSFIAYNLQQICNFISQICDLKLVSFKFVGIDNRHDPEVTFSLSIPF